MELMRTMTIYVMCSPGTGSPREGGGRRRGDEDEIELGQYDCAREIAVSLACCIFSKLVTKKVANMR